MRGILARVRWRPLPFHPAVSTPVYCPVGAAEFPNDNPNLHRGARWVCRDPLGSARAVLRYSARDASLWTLPSGVSRALPPQADRPLANQSPESAAMPPALAVAVARALSFKGPLDIVLGRVLLTQRVEDVPPPPAFVYEPFVPSRRAALKEAAAIATVPANALPFSVVGTLPHAHRPTPIEPSACRVVDSRDARQRVARGWRVDIAPCVAVDSPAPLASAPGQRAIPAEPKATAPVAAALTRPERTRRGRRRGAQTAASLSASPVPSSDEVSRAISELEAAFTERRGHRAEKPHVERRKGHAERVAVERRAACPDSAFGAG
jgi:hypothetical protein